MAQADSVRLHISPLLRLPLELRRLIYAYLLPYTLLVPEPSQRLGKPIAPLERNLTFVRQRNGDGGWRMQKTLPLNARGKGHDIVWRRGCVALLGANKQMYEETAQMLYGENVFVIDVSFDAVRFRYRWVTPAALTPSRTYAFLEHFSMRNLLRIRNYVVNVENVDEYTGMIKHNMSGKHGLLAGVREKLQELVDMMGHARQLRCLQIHLIDGAISRLKFPSGRIHRVQDEAHYQQTQTVLNPFRALRRVRQVRISGVSEEFAEELEMVMCTEIEAQKTG